jgi:hypothetical protein
VTALQRAGDVGELDEDFPMILDPTKPLIISSWGMKGAGKSVLSRWVYTGYPGDKIAIDVNGHAAPGPDAERITELPKRWPTQTLLPGERPRRRNLHYVADPGSHTYADDLDRAVGTALFPKDHRVMLWAGEVGELMPNGRPGPHMRRLLQQNRHHRVSAVFDGPRPMFVDPLVLAQSDYVATFRLPNHRDRARIAENIGFPVAEFEKACHETFRRPGVGGKAGAGWFLLWSTEASKLFRCPPLPIEEAGVDAGTITDGAGTLHVHSDRADRLALTS